MRVQTAFVALLGLGGVVATGGAVSAGDGHVDTLTEWQMPFPDAVSLDIAASGNQVFYTTSAFEEHLGRLDVQTGLVTEWPLPYVASNPGNLAIRPADGQVFMVGATMGEIGQFDPVSGLLRRWALPFAPSNFPHGPWNVVFDGDGAVLFTTTDPATEAGVVGRLDTGTGAVTLWAVPAAMASFVGTMAAGPGHTVFVNATYGPFGIVRLDMTTGVFTSWALASEPANAITADAAGRIYFHEIIQSRIARLVPATGRLTEWALPGEPQPSMAVLAGHVLFGSVVPNGLLALDPKHPGRDSVAPLSPAAQTVAPSSFVLAPSEETPQPQSAQATVSSRPIRRRSNGAFDGWAVAGGAGSVSVTTSPPAIYFTPRSEPAIARITQ